MLCREKFIYFVLVSSCVYCVSAQAAYLHVPGAFSTIQAAVDAAVNGDAVAAEGGPDTPPAYRFWSDKLSAHFYTINEAEKVKLINLYSHVWTYEGPVFYAYPDGLQPEGAKPVYRFWSDTLETHFYTMNETEKNKLIDNYSHVWTYEGVAWCAYE